MTATATAAAAAGLHSFPSSGVRQAARGVRTTTCDDMRDAYRAA